MLYVYVYTVYIHRDKVLKKDHSSCPGRFTRGEITPLTHWIGGWVDPRDGLDDVEKTKILPLPRLEPRPSSL
jgi:hypothetical protein